jgi:hypothetical protein
VVSRKTVVLRLTENYLAEKTWPVKGPSVSNSLIGAKRLIVTSGLWSFGPFDLFLHLMF